MRLSDPATRLGAFLLLLGTVPLAAGCGQAPPGDGERLGSAASAIFGNDETSFDFFVGKGLTAIQAAGIVGNLDQESGDSPTAVESGGPGRGVAQWSVGGRWDTSPGDNENAYVGAANIWDLTSQLDFVWYELTTFPGYGLADLQSQTTISGATTSFMTDFEICGTCDATTRVSYAQAVYDAYGDIPYAATFVAQSFPDATTTLMMTEGQVIPSYIELKNTGSKTWDTNTKIGTTVPRDRVSVFADATWLAPDRPAAVSGSVAPGGTYKFTFDLAAPPTAGLYDEHFGVVEEGVAWFSDPGEGGPADTQLEVKIQVVASASSSSGSSSSGSTSGTGGGSGTGGPDAGRSGSGTGGSASSGTGLSAASSSSGGASDSGSSGDAGQAGGCAAASSGPTGHAGMWILGLVMAAARLGRRRHHRVRLAHLRARHVRRRGVLGEQPGQRARQRHHEPEHHPVPVSEP
jgi:MYXO-CTERM domain-containing protein